MPISTLKIDPRLLPIDWQTATTYTIVVGSDFVREVGNNRSPSPERTTTITTYASGPSVASVSPEFGAVDSSVLTATVTLNRPIEVIPDSGNFYLYKVVEGGPNELIATIPISSNRITISGKDARVSFVDLIEPNETYYLTSDLGLFADIFGFPSSGLEEGVFNYTIGSGPELDSSFPTYDQDDAFVSTATITYDRPVFINTGNFYLNTASGVLRTIPASQVRQLSTGTIAITLYDQTLIENTYHITHDLNAVKSTQGIPHARIVDDSFLRWDNKSLSDQPDQEYDSRTLTELFPDWWDILDRDPDPDKEYALRMFANSGTFVVNGTPSDDLFVRFGTRTELEALDADIIQFSADVKDMNWDLPLTTTLMKDATVIATRQNTLIGKPYDLDSLVLVSNTFTNSVGSSTVLTVTANTNSSITSEVTFRTSSTVFGTSTFVNNVATLTLQPDTLSAGTYNIFADWDGQTIVPKFNGRDSNSIQQTYLNRSAVNLNLLSPLRYFKNNLDGLTFSDLSTASVEISNIYPTHLPDGTAQLFEGNTLLSTGQIEDGQGVITWNPGNFNQIDQGDKVLTVRYLGDSWNNTGTNNFVFNASTRRTAQLDLQVSSSFIVRPATVRFDVSTDSPFDNKLLKFVASTGTFTQSTFNMPTDFVEIDARRLGVGVNSVFARFDQDFSFNTTVSNTVTFTIIKGTPDDSSLSFTNSSTFAQPVLFTTNYGSTEAKGTSTIEIVEADEYAIIPTEVVVNPRSPSYGANRLVLRFKPADRVKMFDFNAKFSGTSADSRLKLVFNNEILEFLPGTTNTYALLVDTWMIGSPSSQPYTFDDFFLEIWQDSTQLGNPSNPISPFFNTSTWLSLNTGTVSLIVEGQTPIQHSTSATLLESKQLNDLLTSQSLLTLPYGYWKATNKTGSDADANYIAPDAASIQIARINPSIEFTNITSLFDGSSALIDLDVTPINILSIPDAYFPNKQVEMVIKYRIASTIDYPQAPETNEDSDAIWLEGPIWKQFTFNFNFTGWSDGSTNPITGPAPRIQSSRTRTLRDQIGFNLSIGSSGYPVQGATSGAQPTINIEGVNYWVNGCYFELTYNGSSATSNRVAIPGRYVKGYAWRNIPNQTIKNNAVIITNSAL